jgi:Glycine zipper 2TM domain
MNRKLLSAAVLAVATSLSAPLVLADRGDRDRDDYREVRVHQVEERYSRHDNGNHRGWYKENHKYKNHHGHGSRHDYYERREYREYGSRADRDDGDYYPERRSSSSAPIILGSVIGGVIGHEIGRGDPGHTAVGAVIGTVIGYDIARHR